MFQRVWSSLIAPAWYRENNQKVFRAGGTCGIVAGTHETFRQFIRHQKQEVWRVKCKWFLILRSYFGWMHRPRRPNQPRQLRVHSGRAHRVARLPGRPDPPWKHSVPPNSRSVVSSGYISHPCEQSRLSQPNLCTLIFTPFAPTVWTETLTYSPWLKAQMFRPQHVPSVLSLRIMKGKRSHPIISQIYSWAWVVPPLQRVSRRCLRQENTAVRCDRHYDVWCARVCARTSKLHKDGAQ